MTSGRGSLDPPALILVWACSRLDPRIGGEVMP